jgi:hypothetical protein
MTGGVFHKWQQPISARDFRSALILTGCRDVSLRSVDAGRMVSPLKYWCVTSWLISVRCCHQTEKPASMYTNGSTKSIWIREGYFSCFTSRQDLVWWIQIWNSLWSNLNKQRKSKAQNVRPHLIVAVTTASTLTLNIYNTWPLCVTNLRDKCISDEVRIPKKHGGLRSFGLAISSNENVEGKRNFTANPKICGSKAA